MWNSSNMRIFLDDSGLETNIPNPRQGSSSPPPFWREKLVFHLRTNAALQFFYIFQIFSDHMLIELVSLSKCGAGLIMIKKGTKSLTR
jgi:hypothetical protein